MHKILNTFGVLFVIFTAVLAHLNIEQIVDGYERWYDKRSQEALNYQFPTDARIHEAEDKVPQGKYLHLLLLLMRLVFTDAIITVGLLFKN